MSYKHTAFALKKRKEERKNQRVDSVYLILLIFYKICKLGLYLCKKKQILKKSN